MWKKVVAILFVIAVALGLAAWGMGPKALVNTDAGSISQKAYYSSLKATNQGQTVLANMTIKKVLDDKYKSKVSKDEISSQYAALKSQYGSSLSSLLESNNMTEDSYKESLYIQQLERAAVSANTTFSKDKLKKQYDEYTPTVNVSVILTSTKSKAQKVIDKLNEGKSFTSLVKKYSKDSTSAANKGKVAGFDSTDTTWEDNFKEAAFALNKGDYTTEPIKSSTQSGYYVIKMRSRADKKSYTQLKSKMKSILLDSKMNDTDYVQAIVGKELAKANVSIKDSTLKNALSTYTAAAASSEASKKTKASSSSSESSSSDSSSSSSESSSSDSSSSSSDESSSSSESN